MPPAPPERVASLLPLLFLKAKKKKKNKHPKASETTIPLNGPNSALEPKMKTSACVIGK